MDKTIANKLRYIPIKITSNVDHNYWLKIVDSKLNESSNEISIKVSNDSFVTYVVILVLCSIFFQNTWSEVINCVSVNSSKLNATFLSFITLGMGDKAIDTDLIYQDNL